MEEILKNSEYAEEAGLSVFVYTEYLQHQILKHISNGKFKNSFYLFGAFYNRIKFKMKRFGNSLDFFTKSCSATECYAVNSAVKHKLELEGYAVKIHNPSNEKFIFEISSDKILDSESDKKIKFKIYLNYYKTDTLFNPLVFKSIISSYNLNDYMCNTRVLTLCPQASLSVTLRKSFITKSVEPIELYDLFLLSTWHKQMCEHNFFKQRELKNIKNALLKAKNKLSNKKFKNTNADNLKITNESSLDKYFNFQTWLQEINI